MNTSGGRRAGLVGTALWYGAVWGLAEATLGHILHLVRVPGLPGLLMVPVAVAIMGRAAVRSRSAAAVFLAGVVAASSKLLDLLVPGTDLLALSRPIQAILLEALAGAVLVRLMKWGTLEHPSFFRFFSRFREDPSLRLCSGHCLWLPGPPGNQFARFPPAARAPLSSDGDLRGNAHRSRERESRKWDKDSSNKGRA